MSARRYIAYGAGGAFQNVVLHGLLPFACDYAVDNFFEGTEFHGIPVRRPSALDGESREDTCLVLFAMSSAVYRLWRQSLSEAGFPERNILYYGDLFFDGLQRRMERFGVRIRRAHYEFAQAASTVFPIDNHSSTLGTAVLLGLIDSADGGGAVAELGAYKGGNALLANLVATVQGSPRPYHIVDSFEGFPALSPNDPAASSAMFRDGSYEDIQKMFSVFPHVTLHRGFIPAILSALPEQRYAAVYYDCDLYEPAVHSLQYFFPRLQPGGFLLVHDYLPKLGGFDGVKKAVDAFLAVTPGADTCELPETTHIIVRKR